MKEQLERDIAIIDKALLDLNELEDGIPIKTIDSLHIERSRLKTRLSKLYNTKEQREFKNKDFHVKVWQDSEKIGIETFWIREGFEYVGRVIRIENYDIQGIALNAWAWFTLYIPKEDIYKKKFGYFYSDIVTELEKADKLSKEKTVSIWQVIEECKGVTGKEEMIAMLDKYEYTTSYNKTYMLTDNTHYLGDPISFIICGHQLRLKEEK